MQITFDLSSELLCEVIETFETGRTSMQAFTEMVVISVFLYVCIALIMCPINKFHFLIEHA